MTHWLPPWTEFRYDPGTERLWELYHENSRRRTFELARKAEAEDDESGFADRLPYPGHRIALQEWLAETPAGVRSASPSASDGIGRLATLLTGTYGERTGEESADRPVHSEGNRWPIELYVRTQDVGPLTDGLFYFDPVDRALVRLSFQIDAVGRLAPGLDLASPWVIVVVTAVFGRSTRYFGERGYRHCCMEAGEVLGHMRLLAEGLGVKAEPVLEFHDAGINESLGIDGVGHAALGLLVVSL